MGEVVFSARGSPLGTIADNDEANDVSPVRLSHLRRARGPGSDRKRKHHLAMRSALQCPLDLWLESCCLAVACTREVAALFTEVL